MPTLETIEVVHNPSGSNPAASVIWLHGLGADGNDFKPIVPELGLSDHLSVRFIFPNAPIRPVTINMGYEMRSWYDIKSISEEREIDEQQLQASCDQLVELIEREISRGVPSDRIVVAGFSQGGAVALTTAPRYHQRLAGVMALSTYLPEPGWIENGRSETNASLPVFMGHGTQDPVVAYQLGISARRHLKEWGYPVDWHEYPMEHSVCLEEIEDISRWLIPLLA